MMRTKKYVLADRKKKKKKANVECMQGGKA